nr:GerMN domain-containing protein [Bacillus sp. FJAT-49736]
MASSVYLSGCGLFNSEKKEQIDPPQKITYDSKTSMKSGKKVNENTVMTELYLLDKNGYVVAQTLPLPNKTSVAKQALQYLVKGGPVEELLPNGFQAVLPANTEVDVNIKDGTAIADFSNEFKKYKAEDEEKILESITWTLTQFEKVKKVEIQVNGHKLAQMPVNNTPINPAGLSRKDGINVDASGVVDITNTHPVTVYYPAQNNANEVYYVPVTKRIANSEKNDIKAVVSALTKGPRQNSNLLSAFNSDVRLLSDPKVDNGNVTLNFNDEIISSFEQKQIADEVLEPLVLSLTELPDITNVSIEVNGNTKLVDEKGKSLTKPVERPEKVNTGSF